MFKKWRPFSRQVCARVKGAFVKGRDINKFSIFLEPFVLAGIILKCKNLIITINMSNFSFFFQFN